jgi:putative acetyltransferase
MKIRTAGRDDYPGIRKCLDIAFGQTAEGDVVDRLRSDDSDSLELVAAHHGDIIGTAMFSPASAHLASGDILRGLALGPVAVYPDDQNKGIGSALIEAGLEHFRPYPVAFFCVLGAPDYYARFSFTPAIERGWTWSGDDGSIAGMRHAFQIIIPRPLPASNGIIQYHPAFGV